MLKRIIPMLIGFTLVTFVASAQFVDVPDVVLKAFDQKFPDAKQVEWLHNIGKPEVRFMQNEKKCKARFTSKGVWEETETKITEADLPAEVADGLHKSNALIFIGYGGRDKSPFSLTGECYINQKETT